MDASCITQDLVDRAVSFHGHLCPGLSIGIRAAAWAIRNFGTAADEEIVAVTETDMCAVDAIQALAG
ncbi:MAG: FmdE family protein, partial [Mailhella sp.]